MSSSSNCISSCNIWVKGVVVVSKTIGCICNLLLKKRERENNIIYKSIEENLESMKDYRMVNIWAKLWVLPPCPLNLTPSLHHKLCLLLLYNSHHRHSFPLSHNTFHYRLILMHKLSHLSLPQIFSPPHIISSLHILSLSNDLATGQVSLVSTYPNIHRLNLPYL